MAQITQLKRFIVYTVLVLVCATWGGAFVAIKYLLDYLTPVQLVKYRYLIASAIFVFILIYHRSGQIKEIFSKHLGKLCLVSFFGVIGYNLSLAYGEVKIAAGTASIITNLSPIFNMILAALFLKERFNTFKTIGLFLSLFGLFVIVQFGSGTEIKLDYYIYALITLIAPLSWAIYTVVNKPLRDKFDTVTVTGLSLIVGTIPFIFFIRIGDFQILASMPVSAWLSLFFLAIACTILGFTGWIWALGKLPSTEVASFTYLAPVFSVIFGYIFLDEKITIGIVIGAAILLFGVYITNKEPKLQNGKKTLVIERE